MADGPAYVDKALRSYDVFDTVLTRLVGSPTSVFLLLGHALVERGDWPGTPEQFLSARISAESRARFHAGKREVTIVQIYEEIRHAHQISAAVGQKYLNEELRLEEKLLRPVPAMLARLHGERAMGFRLAFISDMYLPASLIRGWLERFELCRLEDALWVSSESGATKANGDLFDVVGKFSRISPESWIHAGDNKWADDVVPKKKGIGTDHVTACHLTELELTMERFNADTAALSSLLAGASRWTRLTFSREDATHSALNDFAAQVAGPALYAFLLWIVRRAQRTGVRRVWFTAECGQVLIPMMEAISHRLQAGIELGDPTCDNHLIIVDVGWDGGNALTTAELAEGQGNSLHTYLYFGLYSRHPACSGLDMAGYLFDIDKNHAVGVGDDIALLPPLMKIFTQGDCDRFGTDAWDVRLFRERMRAFADSVSIELCAYPDADLREMVAVLLRKVMMAPTPDQARLIARRCRWRDVGAAFRQGRWPCDGVNWWAAGARVLTPAPIRGLIHGAAELGRSLAKRSTADVSLV